MATMVAGRNAKRLHFCSALNEPIRRNPSPLRYPTLWVDNYVSLRAGVWVKMCGTFILSHCIAAQYFSPGGMPAKRLLFTSVQEEIRHFLP
jgi:hypothetical protein